MSAENPEKIEMEKAYDASKVEDGVYARWEESGFFNPDNLPGKRTKPFTIVMPPPNATGTLHVGHAVMLALEDLMIRYHRMRGDAALWIPGTDHASIATQAKVEKLLIEQEKKNRHDLGREDFLKRVEEFVEGSQGTIRKQIRKMGSSCDWSREAYTLDTPRSEAVQQMFLRMYEDGLMYRGERVVNWCPNCASTLADDEVEYKEEKTALYYFKYGPIVIATARPETKFLDKTIVVHPDDPRYKDLIGKEFDVEWIDGKVRANVIADPEMDINFGTGAMTITPAHSVHDFELARQYKLPVVKIIDEKGNFTAAAGPSFIGKNARASRKDIVKILQEKGLVEKIDENYVHNVSVCYRCGTPIEPLPSLQWFIDVNKKIPGRKKSLKELALEAVKSEKIEIIPDRFTKVYYHWMENLHDWCISRQIWFGHRIPAWYKDEEIRVAKTSPGAGWKQDSDTFDTWFSSGTWTFSTLGWPEKTKDLKKFHPTQVLETGYDILFFWIARMILMTTYAMKDIPFEKVYLHGLVRDEQGRKMSKSLGNIIDPLDVSAKYGTDAVRLSLILGTAPGADSKISEEKIAGFRNFTNKLWNISRFVLTSVSSNERVTSEPKPKTLADTWILERLAMATERASELIEKFDFSAAGETLRDFTWTEFADWYLEIAKIQMQDAKLRASTEKVLLYTLEVLLKLWHPFMPFVTEAVWSEWTSNTSGTDFLMIESWPKSKKIRASSAQAEFARVQEIITAIRNLRSEYKVEPAKRVDAMIVAGSSAKLLRENTEVIRMLARLEKFEIVEKGAKPEHAASVIAGGVEIFLPLAGLVDPAKEKTRLEKEKANLVNYISSLEAKLSNPGFTDKAPKEVIEKNQTTLKETKDALAKIEASLAGLR